MLLLTVVPPTKGQASPMRSALVALMYGRMSARVAGSVASEDGRPQRGRAKRLVDGAVGSASVTSGPASEEPELVGAEVRAVFRASR
ncbi:hypothetical protein AB0877_29485 [Micromonospora sp. NPDC047644]|uniref:hypothetical protein n=1 Tax=Micromonospora sp. NPDC047644 TaxID=3157203 RepID=UPI0034539E32